MEARRRGRPAEGQRVAVRLPEPLIILLDDRAERTGASRAQVIRSILQTAMDPAGPDGVDRAQIRRMLRMSPAERVQHMVEVVNRFEPFRGVATRT